MKEAFIEIMMSIAMIAAIPIAFFSTITLFILAFLTVLWVIGMMIYVIDYGIYRTRIFITKLRRQGCQLPAPHSQSHPARPKMLKSSSASIPQASNTTDELSSKCHSKPTLSSVPPTHHSPH
jgi:hypothetical protein